MVTDENVWLRPLFFDMTTGSHWEILRVRRGGVPGRHRHPSPVYGYVIEGAGSISSIPGWRARALMSWTTGEEHTLTVDDADEMQTFFFIDRPVLHVDDDDRVIHVEDNLGLVRQCREHFDSVCLGAGFVDQMIR